MAVFSSGTAEWPRLKPVSVAGSSKPGSWLVFIPEAQVRWSTVYGKMSAKTGPAEGEGAYKLSMRAFFQLILARSVHHGVLGVCFRGEVVGLPGLLAFLSATTILKQALITAP